MKEKEEAKAKKGAGEKEKRMGAPKQKWTSEEEEALVSGVNKHGAGKWRTIQKDPEFSQHLSTRSNIDLKDKWRNMSVSAGGQGSREKVKTPKLKSLPAPPFTPAGMPWSSTPSQAVEGASTPALDSARSPQDAKISVVMILEALTTLNEPNGVDISAIRNFIEVSSYGPSFIVEQKHEIPANKRLLGAKLRRLITQNKAEKIDKGGYKVKDSSSFATKMPTPKQKEPGIRLSRQQAQNPGGTNKSTEAPDCIEQTADAIAYRISDAESKSYLAAQAVKDLEMIRSLVDEQEALTLLAQEIFERCKRGEIVTLA